MIESPYSGERIEFVEDSPGLLAMRATWPRPGRRGGPHAHPGMEERWTVLEGTAAFRIGDEPEREAGPGDTITAAPGVAHEAWNPTAQPVVVRIEMRPALRWREFVERLFSGSEDPRALVAEFPDEIRAG